MFRFNILDTPWGPFAYVARSNVLVATYLPHKRDSLLPKLIEDWAEAEPNERLLPKFKREADAYFKGEPATFDFAIDFTDRPPFHRKVLEACRTVKYGETISYGGLAARAGNPRAARAVGQAMRNNPLPLIIPCHRVLQSNGGIGGFNAPEGVCLKRRMLDLEASRQKQPTGARS